MRQILATMRWGGAVGGLLLLTASCFAAAEAPTRSAVARPASADRPFDDSVRRHWSFQPVTRPAVPAVQDAAWPRNPIDHFVLARLEARGWTPAPAAEPAALVRRLYLDLIGLPPDPDEQASFARDASPESVDALVDRLLAHPGYGERWGRHWLDLVRYAETNGYERDAEKPHVWRYRDYVIRALNDDKPYDRFIIEQLAGDELDDANGDTMIATGYYRLGPWDDEPADPMEDRFDQLDDMVNTTSQVFLGLTLACARCHDHKFEPLTAQDYYRMVAVLNPLSRPRDGRRELDLPVGSRVEIDAESERDRKIGELRGKISQARTAFRDKFLAAGSSKLPPAAVAAFLAPESDRTDAQKALVKEHTKDLDNEVAAALDDDTRAAIATADAAIAQLQADTPSLPRGYFLWESSPTPPVTHLLFRGKAAQPGPVVEPGVPAVLATLPPTFPPAGPHTSRRRLALAHWIAHTENPLTARVLVNRVWQHHFGAGIVRTPSDFGVMGEPPTHPELLDWLADWFVHDAQWSIKKLHRLILSSNTYRMSRQWRADYAREDPQNHLLWRVSYRRLEAEAIRDSMLAVSGQLNRTMYGPPMYPHVPRAALEGHSDPDKIWKPFDEREASRRTVYAFVKRSLVIPMLEVLDFCDTTKSSAQRTVTSVAPQALTLLNSDFVNRQAGYLAQRLRAEVGDDSRAQIDRAVRLTLCRAPTAAEQQGLEAFLEREIEQLRRESTAAGEERASEVELHRRALEQMCRVILNLNEFVYPD